MADVKFLLREDIDWTDSLVIVAFPTAGSAASIAGHYLRRRLDLPLVGSMHLRDQSPVIAVQDGIATSPLRIHGGQVECRLGDEKCPSVYLISTDLTLQPEAMRWVGEAIVQETRGARMVLCLDAIIRDPGDDAPDVFCASPDAALRDVLISDKVAAIKEGIVIGMSGQILLEAEARGLPAASLLVEAAEDLPDGRAAVALIQAIDALLPTVPIDAKPLLEEALELEKKFEEAARKAARTQGTRSSSSFI